MSVDQLADSLGHVYFFLQRSETSTKCQTTPEQSQRTSRSPSPSAASSHDGSSGSSSGSSLNPLAAKFTPRAPEEAPPTPTVSTSYELRDIPGKGKGLVATDFIPMGTCLICEEPLLRLTENIIPTVWGPYCRLSNSQKEAYDALHDFKPKRPDFDQQARMHLIDRTDTSLDEEDIEEIVANQVRVMSVFACNNVQAETGNAVFATSSRLNHSCVPSVHHSFNPTLQKLTVHATRDIEAGEELCTTYLGGLGSYWTRTQRMEVLRTAYGFTCQCLACMDRTGASDNRREVMKNIALALDAYNNGGQQGAVPVPHVPTSALIALKQCEDLLAMFHEEGLVTPELCKAFRTASTLSLQLKLWDQARDYAIAEAKVERVCMGEVLDDLYATGAAAGVWREFVRSQRVKAGVEKPKRAPRTAQQKAKIKEKKARRRAQLAGEKAAEKRREKEEVKRTEMEKREEERRKKEYEEKFPALA